MKNRTAKDIDAEIFVDNFIAQNRYPPSYFEVAFHFGLKSTSVAFHRCRNFRHKMSNRKKKNSHINLKIDNINELKKIGEIRDAILRLIHSDVNNEDLIEYMLEPIENILTENGVNLKETDY